MVAGQLLAQTGQGYKKEYKFLKSGNLVADKNFYLCTVIGQSPRVKELITKDESLKSILQQKMAVLKNHINDTCSYAFSLLGDFRWNSDDSLKAANTLSSLYAKNTDTFDAMINNHLRPSGYYQRFIALPNEELLQKAFGQYVIGINYIIDQFGYGKKMRYPRIDSVSYKVNSNAYRTYLKSMFPYLYEQADDMQLFFQPSLAVALQLMDMNDRDEPARHEPMEQKDNKKAFDKVKTTQWQKYQYAAIVVPGSGPDLYTTPLSPVNKMRLDLVATRFRKGIAPFIILSGGYCYPFGTHYAEAVEMKKYLMQKYNLPEESLIIDPHARHTTTNFRNANRLIIRYGIPADKPCVFVTTKAQADYVINPNFDVRNKKELGYLPYRELKRLTDHDIFFYPTFESLHTDPYDPLDP
jgi:hypothetical protein